MTEDPLPEYLEPYRRAVQEHGPGFHATLWGSRDAQELRFDVMIAMVDFSGAVILDIGSGQGDFAARLCARDVAFQAYRGIDGIEEMVTHARERGIPRTHFFHADPLAGDVSDVDEPYDYACLSGTLNAMHLADARLLVAGGFSRARRGVIFNFLSEKYHPRWEGKLTAPARRFDPVDWLQWSLDLSSRVRFDQSYLDGHDATILIEKDTGETSHSP